MRTVSVGEAPSGMVTNTFPYDKWHDRYQEYYRTGLQHYLQSRGEDLRLNSQAHFPAFLKVLRRVHEPQPFGAC
jgi:hypothetical protein